MTTKRLVVLRSLQAVIVAGALLITGGIAVWTNPPLFIWGSSLFQKQYPMCRASGFYQGAQQRIRQIAMQRTVDSQSKLLKTDGPYELWATPHGEYWVPAGNAKVLTVIVSQQMTGLYDVDGRTAKPGEVVIDAGAHIGIYTRQVLNQGASLVVAIEPAPANVECYKRNFAKEIADHKVILLEKGIWDKEDVLPLYESQDNTAADGFVEKGVGQRKIAEIPLTTVDHIAADLKLSRIDRVKMDIKGATAKALRGSTLALRKWHPTIVVSSEEDVDEPGVLVDVVKSIQPVYQVGCGACSLVGGVIHPDVLVFSPRL